MDVFVITEWTKVYLVISGLKKRKTIEKIHESEVMFRLNFSRRSEETSNVIIIVMFFIIVFYYCFLLLYYYVIYYCYVQYTIILWFHNRSNHWNFHKKRIKIRFCLNFSRRSEKTSNVIYYCYIQYSIVVL